VREDENSLALVVFFNVVVGDAFFFDNFDSVFVAKFFFFSLEIIGLSVFYTRLLVKQLNLPLWMMF
jgi:hypothetical protein